MKRTRQFSGASKPRTFFDRKVRPQGGGCSISVTKLIPKTWRYVRLRKVRETDTSVTVRIEKLLGEKQHAPNKKADKGHK